MNDPTHYIQQRIRSEWRRLHAKLPGPPSLHDYYLRVLGRSISAVPARRLQDMNVILLDVADQMPARRTALEAWQLLAEEPAEGELMLALRALELPRFRSAHELTSREWRQCAYEWGVGEDGRRDKAWNDGKQWVYVLEESGLFWLCETHGDGSPYEVTTQNCTCQDFQTGPVSDGPIRKPRACKHMLRLWLGPEQMFNTLDMREDVAELAACGQ